MEANLDTFCSLCNDLSEKQKKLLPLCAAENAVSPFSKIPLDSFIQEKYIMGGVMVYDDNNNFIEGKDLFSFYEFLNNQCQRLFHCLYADARTLSGVNAVMVLLMSLFKEGDTIMITSEDSGGHGSMPLICHRLGIKTLYLPFDYELMDYDYDRANLLLEEKSIDGILICPSDIIFQPHLYNFKLPEHCVLIYDATQTLGLIATNENINPFNWYSLSDKFILMGATHKTLPGPTCGLIMTKNLELAARFDTIINPDYLRNVQLHQILSLILTLMEIESFGHEYNKNIIQNVNLLGGRLKDCGMQVIQALSRENFSETHQLWLHMNEKETKTYINRCEDLGITLNARYKKLYHGSGIRLGIQEITRYGWGHNEIDDLSEILWELSQPDCHTTILKQKIQLLTEKKHMKYTFDENKYQKIYNALHHS